MNPLATAVIKSGLLTQATLDEFRRWRPPVELPEEATPPPETIEEAAKCIEEVLQSEGYVITRETDLEVLQQYMTTQRKGELHIEIFVSKDEPNRTADFEVYYGRTRSGEYIFAYRGDTMAEEITNGLSYLAIDEGDTGGKVFFKETREVFYGTTKAFMVCSPPLEKKAPSDALPPLLTSIAEVSRG
jgi:hypothetical protein